MPGHLPALDYHALDLSVQAFKDRVNAEDGFAKEVLGDGKSIGTYVEKGFQSFLRDRYAFVEGNSARELDLPGLGFDIKTTSQAQPQSSAKWESDNQAIFGLGYGIALFVYDRMADGRLRIVSARVIPKEKTGHPKLTRELRTILAEGADREKLLEIFDKYKLRFTPEELDIVVHDLLGGKPVEAGEVTLTRAFQWRLSYPRNPNGAGETIEETEA